MPSYVVAVHCQAVHVFSKATVPHVVLVEGHGVRGDAHYGVTVKHRSRVTKDPTQANLRQVHLIHEELFAEVLKYGFPVRPGQMGENITTRGIDLLSLATGTRLKIGADAVVEVTGLRNPCSQIENFKPGLLAAVLGRTADGSLLRKSGIMGIVLNGGLIQAGDAIAVVHEPTEYRPLQPV
jgi:MOSC domain-containing protein YiiM